MDARRAVAIEISELTRVTRWNAAAVDERDYLTGRGATGNVDVRDAQSGEQRAIASIDVWIERAVGTELGATFRVVAEPDAAWRGELYIHAPRRVYADLLDAANDAAGRLEFSCRLPVSSAVVMAPGTHSAKFVLEDVVLGVTRRIPPARDAGDAGSIRAGDGGYAADPPSRAAASSQQQAALGLELGATLDRTGSMTFLREIETVFGTRCMGPPAMMPLAGGAAAEDSPVGPAQALWAHVADLRAFTAVGACALSMPADSALEGLAARYCADARARSPTLEWMLVDALVASATARLVRALPARWRVRLAARRLDAPGRDRRRRDLVRVAAIEAAWLGASGYAALLLAAPSPTLFWIIFLGANGIRWLRPDVATWRCRREETALALALDMHAVYGRVATPAFHPGQIRALLAALEARGASVSAWVYHLLDKRAAGAGWIASA